MAGRLRILSFVSEFPNIGNYTAFWGVDQLLAPDYWPARRIDCRQYEEVDARRYDVALVGGAGLLAAGFGRFWAWLAAQEVPVIIMGVGVCLPDRQSAAVRRERGGVPRLALAALGKRLLYTNVRDELTREFYDLVGADVTFCPSLAFLRARFRHPPRGRNVLYVHHGGLASSGEGTALRALSDDATDNLMEVRTPDQILEKYLAADVVITTRLHGAVIGAALGRPYVAVAHDSKLRAFHRQHGGGILVESTADVPAVLDEAKRLQPNISLAALERSAARVKAVLAGLEGTA
jgi:hypothetical protein